MSKWVTLMVFCQEDGSPVRMRPDFRYDTTLRGGQVFQVLVLSEDRYTVSLKAESPSCLQALEDGIALIDAHLAGLELPRWPAIEISARPYYGELE
jgi:hypothetical protein